ncbi:MAG: hypothetical protein Salg2KO_03380 [Salibacteraceae bacterium]
MNRLITILVVLIVVACEDSRCLKSIGKHVAVKRSVQPFSRINISDKVNLITHFDSTYSVRVEAGENIEPNIVTDVRGNWLIIEDRNTCDFLRSYDHEINVHIYAPSLKEIKCSNSGNIRAMDTITAGSFSFNQEGASGVNALILNVDTAFLKLHTGTGDLSVSGTCDMLYIYAASYGQMDCGRLITKSAWVEVANTGDVMVNVVNRIRAFLNGFGDIRLISTPTTIIQEGEGPGKLVVE